MGSLYLSQTSSGSFPWYSATSCQKSLQVHTRWVHPLAVGTEHFSLLSSTIKPSLLCSRIVALGGRLRGCLDQLAGLPACPQRLEILLNEFPLHGHPLCAAKGPPFVRVSRPRTGCLLLIGMGSCQSGNHVCDGSGEILAKL